MLLGVMMAATQANSNDLVFNPFAYVVLQERISRCCSYCLAVKPYFQMCNACKYVRYCDTTCSIRDWFDHKAECKFLANGGKDMRNEVHEKVFNQARLVARVVHRYQTILSKQPAIFNPEFYVNRMFPGMLMKINGHEQKMQKICKPAYASGPKCQCHADVYNTVCKFVRGCKKFQSKNLPELTEKTLFSLFCKVHLNFDWVHSSESEIADHIALALYPGKCTYTHSCSPNAVAVYKGFQAILKPITPGLDLNDTSAVSIGYSDDGIYVMPKADRRELLRATYFIDCHCQRCEGEEEHIMTSCKCATCGGPVPIDPEQPPKPAKCVKCGVICSVARIQKALDAMDQMVLVKKEADAAGVLSTLFWSKHKRNFPQETEILTTKMKKMHVSNAKEVQDVKVVSRSLRLKYDSLLHPKNIVFQNLVTLEPYMALFTPESSHVDLHPPFSRRTASLLQARAWAHIEVGDRKNMKKDAQRAVQIMEFLYGKEAGITKSFQEQSNILLSGIHIVM